MWARVHKLDRVKPQARGAIVVIEDERSAVQMQRVPSLSTIVAVARVLAARRALELKFGGHGEVRYAVAAQLPSFLAEAVTHAGAAVATSDGERVIQPAAPAGVSAIVDVAFSELAHHVRGSLGVTEFATALRTAEQQRRGTPLDRDKQPDRYWTAVFELASLAGELSRRQGGRWIETRDLPVPFALKLADSVAHPTVIAQKIVEGGGDELVI